MGMKTRALLALLLCTGALPAEIYVTTECGASWEARGPRNFAVTQLVPDPKRPAVAWAIAMPTVAKAGEDLRFASPAVLRTADLGKTWETISSYPGPDPLCLAVDPLVPDTVYVGSTFGRILKTTDGGKTWTLLNLKLTCRLPDGTAAEPQSNVSLVCARGELVVASGRASGFVAVSDDAGRSWTLRSRWTFETCVLAGDRVYAVTEGGTAMVSLDRGRTWPKLHSGD